jgi:hypothetical protein
MTVRGPRLLRILVMGCFITLGTPYIKRGQDGGMGYRQQVGRQGSKRKGHRWESQVEKYEARGSKTSTQAAGLTFFTAKRKINVTTP